MSAPSSLTITPTGSGLTVVGEIDAHTAPTLATAIADCDQHTVIVDMSSVDFVDSSGLRVLIEAHQAADQNGRSLQLANPSTAVSRLLEISGVSDYLDVVS
ncbi:MAG: STAS domain-containing protein [Ilumatobacteraceae bacterium]